MPRFYFHVRDGQDFPDTEGTELADMDAVRNEALRTSGEMLRGSKGTAGFWSGDDWIMTVTDEEGRPVLTLRFSGVEHARSALAGPSTAPATSSCTDGTGARS